MFSKSFLRTLVRDCPYSHVLEDPISSTTTSPPSPVSFCVFGNDTLCYVLDSCQLVTINSCSMFPDTIIGISFPRPLETPSHGRKLFNYQAANSWKFCTEIIGELPGWWIRGMRWKLVILECHLLFLKNKPQMRKTFSSIHLLMLPFLP